VLSHPAREQLALHNGRKAWACATLRRVSGRPTGYSAQASSSAADRTQSSTAASIPGGSWSMPARRSSASAAAWQATPQRTAAVARARWASWAAASSLLWFETTSESIRRVRRSLPAARPCAVRHPRSCSDCGADANAGREAGTSRISTSQPNARASLLSVLTEGECLPTPSNRETALLVAPM